jgi:peptide/nickel transport system permease protein
VLKYTLYRLATLVPLLFGLSVAMFLYIHLIPGDPVAGMLGPGGSPRLIAQLRHQFGLDQPIPVQYWHWLTGLLQGNLGISFISRQPITSILVNRIPASLELTAAGMVAIVLFGWPAGFVAGLLKGTWFDRVVSTLAAVGLSVPQFWLGTLFIVFIAVNHVLGLPAEGYVPFTVDPVANLRDVILPALTLGLSLSSYLVRMTRAATIEVQQEQFVRQAQAKGLRRWTIVWRYSARNAVLPVVIVLGLQLGALLGGQVIVEELFNWPGVGTLLVIGVTQRDYFLVQAVILVIATFYVFLYLGTELIQAWLDPRLRR